MTLAPGAKLGPYEIVAPLGSGGMGEVWRAKDTRLDRAVAIKVLPAHLSANPEMRQRMEREARAISALSHPNICTLFDVGHQDGMDFLVMELLEGEALDARLKKGPLSREQVLRHAMEIASALEKAHRQGVVHRDLKPANIILTKAGAKLLDFGLAKLAGTEGAPVLGGAISATSLPTERRDLTAEGTILGTFQYMAPEQLEGREADARTDIFAFGSVLYEMATGRKAFSGRSQASLIAAILSSEPPAISTIQPMLPPALDRLVQTCLAKDPDDRWQSAHDIAAELRWIAEGGSQAGVPAPVAHRRRSREKLAWGVAGVAAIVAIASLIGLMTLRRATASSPSAAVRASLLPPEKAAIDYSNLGGSLSLSPDGRHLTFAVHRADGRSELWLRALDAMEARPIPGTEGGFLPFWSPDSRFIAYFAQGKLMKVDLSGAPPVAICDAQQGRPGAWSRDGVILFAPSTTSPIHRVAASGGVSEPVTTLDHAKGETTHRWVTLLPDGKHFLYLAVGHAAGVKSDINAVYEGALGSQERTLVMSGRSNVAYADGRLLFVRDGVLLAQPFDPARGTLSSDAVPLAQGVMTHNDFFHTDFAASDTGVLLYHTGEVNDRAQLAWYDRTGKMLEPVGTPENFNGVRISRDGKRYAEVLVDPESGTSDIWLNDFQRQVRTRFTFGAFNEDDPIWSPDDTRIAYREVRKIFGALVVKPADGSGTPETLLEEEGVNFDPNEWSPDGRYLLYVRTEAKDKVGKGDLWALPMTGERKPFAVLATPADESAGTLSPDGRWLLYASDESGRIELYVTRFPTGGGKWQVSSEGSLGGGLWCNDGKEIMYGQPGPPPTPMSVPVQISGSSFQSGRPVALFPITRPLQALDLSRDGQRFLLAFAADTNKSDAPISLILGWPALVRK